MFRPFRAIPLTLHVDFVAKRWWAFSLTFALVLASLAAFTLQGLNFGIDFKGGIVIEARSSDNVDFASLRAKLNGLGLGEVTLQEFGGPTDVLLRVQRQTGDDDAQQRAVESVKSTLGPSYDYRRIEVVGPTVGRELLHAGLAATAFAIFAIALYVGVRFEWQFGVAAFIATLHDVFVTAGLYAILGLDFNLTSVAALLTLAGYSINDTVVVFDRIRETLRRQKTNNLKAIINDSVNQTLSRTLMTAGTTLLALIPLVFFGGSTLFGFSLALTWGILVGTYSSIYVAAALLLYMPPLRRLESRS